MLDDPSRTPPPERRGPARSLRAIAALPLEERAAWVRRFLPSRLLARYDIDPETFLNPAGERVVQHGSSAVTGEARVTVWRRLADRDPLTVVEAADTANGQIELVFLSTADPEAPRFDVDVDESGRPTLLGAARRNIPAEVAALEAGLAPGQVRRGLGLVLREFIPQMEAFMRAIEQTYLLAYPLGYHNAILMERWGFDYLYGRSFMQGLNERFGPGGDLRARLDGSTPFRQPGLAETARGRSWAIHDGILGEPMPRIKLIRRVGHDAGVRTFEGEY